MSLGFAPRQKLIFDLIPIIRKIKLILDLIHLFSFTREVATSLYTSSGEHATSLALKT